jgi:hypothetical protein
MFRTVPLEIASPSFFSSPMMRPRPQPFSLAIWTTSSRTSSGLRGRLPFDSGFSLPTDFVSPFTQRANVRGVTMVTNSLTFLPSGFPRSTSRSRSAGVRPTRVGSLLRRMRFSVFR